MKRLTKLKFFLWYFGHVKVPLIGYTRPRLIELSDTKIIIKIPLNRRTKNHLNSMYFGALAVGADLAGGFHGLYHAKKASVNVSLVFKSFSAQFLSRPESDVYFVGEMGDTVKAMIKESCATGKRVNKPVPIKAFTDYECAKHTKEVANFVLELSLKTVS